MGRLAAPIELTRQEDTTLTAWRRSRTLPVRQVQRARIVQLAAAGMESQEIAATPSSRARPCSCGGSGFSRCAYAAWSKMRHDRGVSRRLPSSR